MRKLLLLLGGFVLLVAACGSDTEEPTDTVPAADTVAGTVGAATVLDTAPPTTAAMMDEPAVVVEEEIQVGGEDEMEPEGAAQEPVTPSPEPTEPEAPPIEAEATLRALGPMRIGMSVEKASAEVGVQLRQDFGRPSTNTCYYVTGGAPLRGVLIMVVEDEIARIEIHPPSTLATRSGVRIGTAADNLRQVYPNNIERADSAAAEGGEALAFVPNDDYDSNYRIYFEIENGQVARYRLGVKPAIDYLGGCPQG